MSEQERERKVSARQGTVSHERDTAIARMDEAEVRERMLETFDLFVRKGFETHLVGLEVRGAIDYRIELEADGHGPIDVRELTSIADQHRLETYVEKSPTSGQLIVVAYARS
jgi:hypothetical protein